MAGGKFFGPSNGSNLVHKAFLRIPNLGDRTRANARRGRASGNFTARLSTSSLQSSAETGVRAENCGG